MFFYYKKFMYIVCVCEFNLQFVSFMFEQFGGLQGELVVVMCYFIQGFGECDFGCKDLLMDIVIEEISYLEIIGIIIVMFNRGFKVIQFEGFVEVEDMWLLGQNSISYIEQILYGGGLVLVNFSGVLWIVVYIDLIGDFSVDLCLNIVVEVCVKLVYECLINVIDDLGIKDVLCFLMICEIVYMKLFEKVLYSIQFNFLLGKLLGDFVFIDLYMDMLQGDGVDDLQGSWNSGEFWEWVSDCEVQVVVDGGDGSGMVDLDLCEQVVVQVMILCMFFDLEVWLIIGVELGVGLGVGVLDLLLCEL